MLKNVPLRSDLVAAWKINAMAMCIIPAGTFIHKYEKTHAVFICKNICSNIFSDGIFCGYL